MKKILLFLTTILISLTMLTSCETTWAASNDGGYNEDDSYYSSITVYPTFDFMINYGTPYYYGSSLYYYYWDGFYYYPSYRSFYSRPLPPPYGYYYPRIGRPRHDWNSGMPPMMYQRGNEWRRATEREMRYGHFGNSRGRMPSSTRETEHYPQWQQRGNNGSYNRGDNRQFDTRGSQPNREFQNNRTNQYPQNNSNFGGRRGGNSSFGNGMSMPSNSGTRGGMSMPSRSGGSMQSQPGGHFGGRR
jgi:hypothetical protein